jgi:hypothetical protein
MMDTFNDILNGYPMRLEGERALMIPVFK